jgi:hypothetical protein
MLVIRFPPSLNGYIRIGETSFCFSDTTDSPSGMEAFASSRRRIDNLSVWQLFQRFHSTLLESDRAARGRSSSEKKKKTLNFRAGHLVPHGHDLGVGVIALLGPGRHATPHFVSNGHFFDRLSSSNEGLRVSSKNSGLCTSGPTS